MWDLIVFIPEHCFLCKVLSLAVFATLSPHRYGNDIRF